MSAKNFAVIGAGAGGQSFAALLTDKGYTVALTDSNKEWLDAIRARGAIKLTDKFEVENTPALITDSTAEAARGADVILVATTADGHIDAARAMAPALRDGQIVVLNPGFMGGSLAFQKALRDAGCAKNILIAETEDLVFACRRVEPGVTRHTGIKKKMGLAALPARRTDEVLAVFTPIFPAFVKTENVMLAGLKNVGAVLHAVPMILNANKIDMGQRFDYYMEGFSPTVANIAEAVDNERLALAKAFGYEVPSVAQTIQTTYGLPQGSLAQTIQNNEAAYSGIASPGNLSHRFLAEDTYAGLVPIAAVGRVIGVPTPVTDSVIALISAGVGIDYAAVGRSADKIGISGMSVSQILAAVS